MNNENASSWAIQTETLNARDFEPGYYASYPKLETSKESMDSRDLRYRLRRSRGEDQNDGLSPVKSPTHPRRHRDTRNGEWPTPNYRRERDGLSPLRSPLNSESRPSRRRSMRDDAKNKKENEDPKPLSPSKRNRYSGSSRPTLSMDVEEHTFRRRLDLPDEKESNEEEQAGGLLNPEIEKERIAIERREKQIAYGKCTDSYKLYIKTVPKEERCVDRKKHPRTPIKTCRCSRRNWDAQVKAWKKYTHQWANVNDPARPVFNSSETESEIKPNDVEDDNVDLNEEDDESFLEGFELDYELGETLDAKSTPQSS